MIELTITALAPEGQVRAIREDLPF